MNGEVRSSELPLERTVSNISIYLIYYQYNTYINTLDICQIIIVLFMT